MPHERADLLQHEELDESTTRTTVKAGPTPLPWRTLSVLLLLTLIQPLAFEIVFPFVNQMILEIGVVTDPERVGFYSGLIESIFSCMSFVTIMPSSYIADRVGRKPVILIGMAGLGISVASFGLSKSFLAMVLTRCVGGAMGGVWACTKIMVGEQTDKTNQASAFMWLGIAYRAGQIVGLPLGGLLAHPERHLSFFQSKFWYEYPFALPCFVASAVAIISVILGYFTLQETLRPRPKFARKSTYGSIPPSTTANPSSTNCNVDDDNPSIRSIMTPSIINLLISNVGMCLASEFLFSVFPLFSFTPIQSGGLGMSEAAIGTQLAIRAILHIVVSILYAPMERYVGSTVRLHRVIMWLWPLAFLFPPILNLLARRGEVDTWLFNAGMFVFFLLWAGAGFCWVSTSIMVTDAAPSAAALATLTGLSQMAIILPQAIAPATATTLFAASIKSGIAGGNLIWIVIFLFTCTAALHSMTIQEPSTNWREDK